MMLDTPPKPGQIGHFKSPAVPNLRFEWHPGNKKVYVIRVGATPEVGDPMAFDIETYGAAWNAVAIYLRGYKEGKSESGHGQIQR